MQKILTTITFGFLFVALLVHPAHSIPTGSVTTISVNSLPKNGTINVPGGVITQTNGKIVINTTGSISGNGQTITIGTTPIPNTVTSSNPFTGNCGACIVATSQQPILLRQGQSFQVGPISGVQTVPLTKVGNQLVPVTPLNSGWTFPQSPVNPSQNLTTVQNPNFVSGISPITTSQVPAIFNTLTQALTLKSVPTLGTSGQNLSIQNRAMQNPSVPSVELMQNRDGSFTVGENASTSLTAEISPKTILDHRIDLELSENQLIGIKEAVNEFENGKVSADETSKKIFEMLGPWQKKTWEAQGGLR